jgi:IclR family acetate operon transcriptional repressor
MKPDDSQAALPLERVQTLERAFGLLELVGSGESVRMAELAAGARLPIATVHRLVRSMVKLGYLRADGDRRYSLGPRVVWLGERAGRQLTVWARPFLQRLVDTTGETASLATLDGDSVVYLAVVPSPHSMRTFNEVGARVPPHCTAVGKVLLAQLPDARAQEIVGRTGLRRYTDRTIAEADTFARAVAETRRRGYATDEGEQEVGVQCVAAPVAGVAGPFAVSVSGPASRLAGTCPTRLAEVVKGVADSLADAAVVVDAAAGGSR